MGNKFKSRVYQQVDQRCTWVVTGKMHESWFEMLMGGDGEAIGVEL